VSGLPGAVLGILRWVRIEPVTSCWRMRRSASGPPSHTGADVALGGKRRSSVPFGISDTQLFIFWEFTDGREKKSGGMQKRRGGGNRGISLVWGKICTFQAIMNV